LRRRQASVERGNVEGGRVLMLGNGREERLADEVLIKSFRYDDVDGIYSHTTITPLGLLWSPKWVADMKLTMV
jgi:hypothetical protein